MADFGQKMIKPGVIDAAIVIVEAFKEVKGVPGNAMQSYMDSFAAAIAAKDPAALTYLAGALDESILACALRYELDPMRVKR